MVKRKASVSIDEWLGEGVFPPRTSITATVEAEGGSVTPNLPTAEEGPVTTHLPVAEVIPGPVPTAEVIRSSVSTEPVATPGANGATQGEGEDHWFWALLEQAGYERW